METKGTTRKTTRRRPTREANLAVGYLRVSTGEQVQSGAGLDAQRAEIEHTAAMRGLTIGEWFVDEGVSGSVAPMQRPQLAAALEALRTGPATWLLFRRSDRVGRKASDLLALRDRADAEGWQLAAADGSVDNSTPHGRLMFTQLAGFAEFERDLIKSRTREALAARRAAGVRLGRPATLPAEVVARIVQEREAGRGWSAIATALTSEGVPTARGGAKWYPATVQKVYNGQDAAQHRAEAPTTA
ncbi:recombinase family protein [Streptomyces sp. SID1328]|uniref:recombinase family protein n=1 Tax=Streptomyces sp. SID1328 TaxID=2690250 RepID=UPI001371FA6C|nr:recombinase family protein [Streptomyces sp. SID1328]MYV42911.1 recombinase family protein [Streptomyces sp. SID1328]